MGNDIFKIEHNEALPGKGCILIAEPFLQGAYFQRAVVLLVEHGEEGALGLILNKQTKFVLNDYFPGLAAAPQIPIYLGGPVGPNRLFFIHTLGKLIPGSQEVADGLYFDGDLNILLEYITQDNDLIRMVKFFSGYSGWSKGQLAGEIKEDSWLTGKPQNTRIMQANGESFWRNSLAALGKKYKAWINFPKNPYLN
ncbi:UPF0301 protein [Bacteroidia bacterium]|nr:UPF0301 protein [Bacteroidia bacterium]